MSAKDGLFMFKIFRMTFVIFISVFVLLGCGILDESIGELENQPADGLSMIGIDELKDTDHFRKGALEHILEGELNGRGQAVGFHYDGLPTKKGKVIQGTETKPNAHGVYEAKVEVSGVAKTSNGGKSTFFPKEWDAQEVVDVINEAYETRMLKTGNTYEGLTTDGQIVRMYLDQDEKIISAFPVW